MNLYDEAIEEATWHGEIEGPQTVRVILKALEHAKKEHALLRLYQKKEQCIVCVPIMKDSPILHCVVRYSDDEKYMRVLSQIKQLEWELK